MGKQLALIAGLLAATLTLAADGDRARIAHPQHGSQDVCRLPPETGLCLAAMRRWHYDSSAGACRQFIYGGCGGNENNFNTQADCEQRCRRDVTGAEDKCSLPREVGHCRASIPRWYYDRAAGDCREFRYGGCGGNMNRFNSRGICEQHCRHAPHLPATDPCLEPPEAGRCRAAIPRWYFDQGAGACREFTWGGCGGNDNKFDTVGACERLCQRHLRVVHVTGPMRHTCNAFQCLMYCAHGFERDAHGCEVCACRSAPAPAPHASCSLPPEAGLCRAAIPRWYYDQGAGACREFTWGGCGGNDNKFDSVGACEQRCGRQQRDRHHVTVVGERHICDTMRCVMHCTHGFERDAYGCEVCTCRPDPAGCPQVACTLYCPRGFQADSQGCRVCACRPEADPDTPHSVQYINPSFRCPEIECPRRCPYGYLPDSSGCMTCRCVVPPAA